MAPVMTEVYGNASSVHHFGQMARQRLDDARRQVAALLNASAEEIVQKRNLSKELVRDVIQRVNRNEYKRQQAAPNLKVSPKAFGVGRVFPIAHKYWL